MRCAMTAVTVSRGSPDAWAAISRRLSFGVGSLRFAACTASSSALGFCNSRNVFCSTLLNTVASMLNPRSRARCSVRMDSALWWHEKHARFSTNVDADFCNMGRARATASRVAGTDCGNAVRENSNRTRTSSASLRYEFMPEDATGCLSILQFILDWLLSRPDSTSDTRLLLESRVRSEAVRSACESCRTEASMQKEARMEPISGCSLVLARLRQEGQA